MMNLRNFYIPIKTVCSLNFKRFCNSIHTPEISVLPFSNFHINLPFNLNIRPLDVLEYMNNDKLQIKVTGSKENNNNIVEYEQDKSIIKIFSNFLNSEENINCNLWTPINSNLYITGRKDIALGFFNGAELKVKSECSINVEKYQGRTMELITENGDINCMGVILAENIKTIINNKGNIFAKRLQGINANIHTKEGTIDIKSSYCDNSNFSVERGALNLNHIHKNVKVHIKNGDLKLVGLDGGIKATIEQGNVEMQISRVLENSKIIVNKGNIILKLSDEVQENTKLQILSDQCEIHEDIKLKSSKKDNLLNLESSNNNNGNDSKLIEIFCKGMVKIESVNWTDYFKTSYLNKQNNN